MGGSFMNDYKVWVACGQHKRETMVLSTGGEAGWEIELKKIEEIRI